MRVLDICLRGWCVSLLALAVSACGSDSDDGDSAEDLFAQAPHCPSGADALRVEGTLDGEAIAYEQSPTQNIGFVNTGDSYFASPFSEQSEADSSGLGVRLEWKKAVAHGWTAPLTGGWVRPPAGHPRAEQKLCITQGLMGFVEGGAEDGVFKFKITGVAAPDCTGPGMPVELRGCFD